MTAPVVERRLYAAVLRKASATDGAAVSTVGTCTRHLPEALSPSQMASAQWASCADERWAADEGKLGARSRVLPHNGVARADAFQLGVVNAIDSGIRCMRCSPCSDGLGRDAVHVVEPDSAVRCAGGAHVLKVVLRAGCEFAAKPAIDISNVRDVFHHLHANGAAKHLRFGLALAVDFDDPGRLAAHW